MGYMEVTLQQGTVFGPRIYCLMEMQNESTQGMEEGTLIYLGRHREVSKDNSSKSTSSIIKKSGNCRVIVELAGPGVPVTTAVR